MIERLFRGITYTVISATLNDQVLKGTRNPDWIETLDGDNIVVTGAGNDVVLAGVDFLEIGDFEPFGGEAIFFSPRSDGGNNIIKVGTGDDYVASGHCLYAEWR
jgi:Ca2+-binding RTX toxin-like protein